MNCYSIPLRCFKKVILRLCENSDLIYEIFTLEKRGVTPLVRCHVADVDELNKYKKNTRGTSLLGYGCHISNDQVNNGVGVQNYQRIKT